MRWGSAKSAHSTHTINIWGDHFQSITIPDSIKPIQQKIDGGVLNSDAGVGPPGSCFDSKLPPSAHLIWSHDINAVNASQCETDETRELDMHIDTNTHTQTGTEILCSTHMLAHAWTHMSDTHTHRDKCVWVCVCINTPIEVHTHIRNAPTHTHKHTNPHRLWSLG